MKQILIDLYNEAFCDGERFGDKKSCGKSSVDYACEKIKENYIRRPSWNEIYKAILANTTQSLGYDENIREGIDAETLTKEIIKSMEER